MINSMLNSSRLPHNLWGETLLTANKILNIIPYKKTNKSPYEIWKGRLPTNKIIKVWRCLAKVQIPLPKKTKLGPKTVDCVFIGFSNNSAAYRFLVTDARKIVQSYTPKCRRSSCNIVFVSPSVEPQRG